MASIHHDIREDGAEVETGGKNADDGRRLIVERERLTDDIRIGSEAALP